MLDEGVGYFEGNVERCVVIDRIFSLKRKWRDTTKETMMRYNEISNVKIERCTPHVLRHTFCTKCIAARMDVKTVQYLMGHSDTMRISE